MKLRRYAAALFAAMMLLQSAVVLPAMGAEPALREDFEDCTVGATYSGEALNSSDLPGGGTVSKRVQEKNGNKYLEMIAQNTANSTEAGRVRTKTVQTFDGTFTVQWDYRSPTSDFAQFETYLRNGGNIRVRVTRQGTVNLLVLDAAKVTGVMESEFGTATLSGDKWYTFKAQVSEKNITLTVYDKSDGSAVETLSIAQNDSLYAKLFDPYNIWFDLWGKSTLSDFTPEKVWIDNLVVARGTDTDVQKPTDPAIPSQPAGSAETVIREEFTDYTVGAAYSGEALVSSDLPGGGTVSKRVQEKNGNKYLEMIAQNTANSTEAGRVRTKTVQTFDGTFTVQWDYRSPTSDFAQFETYLRQGGNIRVRVSRQGTASLLVLDAAKVTGVMENKFGKVTLNADKWYTFKAQVSEDNITLAVYDKADGTAVETLTIAQDNSTLSTLFDPYNIWFDLWGNSDLSNTSPAAADLDNLIISKGSYEGVLSGVQEEQASFSYDRVTFQSAGGNQYLDNIELKTKPTGARLVNEGFEDKKVDIQLNEKAEGGSELLGKALITQVDGASLRAAFLGKTVSVLGDSISTYSNYSDNPDYNTTLSGNLPTYPNNQVKMGVEDTWWMQVIRATGLELLVNNSYSGDELNPNQDPGRGLVRCTQLHSDTGADAGTKPDVILSYFGTNDAGAHFVVDNNLEVFKSNYPKLMEKYAQTYPETEVFFFTLLPRSNFDVEPYNEVIRQLVNGCGNKKFHLLDLYRDTGVTQANLSEYTYDNLHPNARGMDAITKVVLAGLKEYAAGDASVSNGKVLKLSGTAGTDYLLDEAKNAVDLSFDWMLDGFGAGHMVGLYADKEGKLLLRAVDNGAGGGKLQFYNGQWQDVGGVVLEQNKWYSLRVVCDGSERAQLFVNGEDVFDIVPNVQLHDCPAAKMTDVPRDAWYHEAVDYALANGLMNGYNETTFGSEDTLSRAMVAQVLYNKEGQPAVEGGNSFEDVDSAQWYNKAVTWAVQRGVMGGYNARSFGPDDPVTLEQLAVILWQYAGKPEFKGNADSVGEHSDWAANGLAWCAENGILGVPYEKVTDPATRAQTAQMLMNYMK